MHAFLQKITTFVCGNTHWDMKKHFALLILLMVSLATTCLARQADHRKMPG